MTSKQAVFAGLAVAGIAVGIWFWMQRGQSGHPHHDKAHPSNVEAISIDRADSSVSMMAMLNAPEGATPCETAFAAVEAEAAAAKLRGSKSMFTWVAAKPEFLAHCQTLPEAAQRCMAPRYRRDHKDDCLQQRPPAETLKQMFVAAAVEEPSYER